MIEGHDIMGSSPSAARIWKWFFPLAAFWMVDQGYPAI